MTLLEDRCAWWLNLQREVLMSIFRSYVALGVPEDASDELVDFAYHSQVSVNPDEGPVYLSHLRLIAEHRNSDHLHFLLAQEYSTGKLDIGQVEDAYRYFGLSSTDIAVSDELVLGTFQARLQDSARQEAELRAHLKTIGNHRRSAKIVEAAEEGEWISDQGYSLPDQLMSVSSGYIPASLGVLRC